MKRVKLSERVPFSLEELSDRCSTEQNAMHKAYDLWRQREDSESLEHALAQGAYLKALGRFDMAWEMYREAQYRMDKEADDKRYRRRMRAEGVLL